MIECKPCKCVHITVKFLISKRLKFVNLYKIFLILTVVSYISLETGVKTFQLLHLGVGNKRFSQKTSISRLTKGLCLTTSGNCNSAFACVPFAHVTAQPNKGVSNAPFVSLSFCPLKNLTTITVEFHWNSAVVMGNYWKMTGTNGTSGIPLKFHWNSSSS